VQRIVAFEITIETDDALALQSDEQRLHGLASRRKQLHVPLDLFSKVRTVPKLADPVRDRSNVRHQVRHLLDVGECHPVISDCLFDQFVIGSLRN
jgi:hypothetical protein